MERNLDVVHNQVNPVVKKPSESRGISRRSFVIGLTTGSVTLAAPGVLKRLSRSQSQESPSDRLKATATALEASNRQSSFYPERGFTDELFAQVQKGTVILKAFEEITNSDGKKESSFLLGATAWLAREEKNKEGSIFYFVTAGHVVQYADLTTAKVIIWRPGIDNEKFEIEVIATESKYNYDVGVIKCRGKSQTPELFRPLDFLDEAEPEVGSDLLIVGFPWEFANDPNYENFFTMGQTAAIKRKGRPRRINIGFSADEDEEFAMGFGETDRNARRWLVDALIGSGNSGSPAVIDRSGKPLVIGIVYRDARGVETFVSPLNVNHLIGKLTAKQRQVQGVKPE